MRSYAKRESNKIPNISDTPLQILSPSISLKNDSHNIEYTIDSSSTIDNLAPRLLKTSMFTMIKKNPEATIDNGVNKNGQAEG